MTEALFDAESVPGSKPPCIECDTPPPLCWSMKQLIHLSNWKNYKPMNSIKILSDIICTRPKIKVLHVNILDAYCQRAILIGESNVFKR